jgi:hypothetical protein
MTTSERAQRYRQIAILGSGAPDLLAHDRAAESGEFLVNKK